MMSFLSFPIAAKISQACNRKPSAKQNFLSEIKKRTKCLGGKKAASKFKQNINWQFDIPYKSQSLRRKAAKGQATSANIETCIWKIIIFVHTEPAIK